MRLSLGTAQFGLDYGITNVAGQVGHDNMCEILDFARENGISHLDTARAYGESETALGQAPQLLKDFEITTKVPSLSALAGNQLIHQIDTYVSESCARIGQPIFSVLLHDVNDILRPEGLQIWDALENSCVKHGVSNVGVSLYDSHEAFAVLERVKPDIVQLPLNILDQRLLASGAIDTLKDAGVSIEARSVFLQGVVLSAPDRLPLPVQGLASAVQNLRDAPDTSPLALALGFIRLIGKIDRAVVGVTKAKELADIVQVMGANVPEMNPDVFAVDAPHLVDPRRWRGTSIEKRAS